jgi:carbamoyl-phosphate synthase large subunit
MKKNPVVLFCAAGGPGGVNLSRSLETATPRPRLIGCDSSPHYLQLARCHRRFLVPRWTPERDFVATIADLVTRCKVDLLLPNNSLEGRLYAAHHKKLGARVLLPSPETFDLGASKWLSYQKWLQAGLPVPFTRLISRPQDLHDIFDTHQSRPIWVRGAGIPGKGIGAAALPCRTVEQAISWVDFWEGWGFMAASEYLPGDNLTWLSVWHEGQLIASQGRQRDAYIIPHVSPSGVTGAPAISHTVSRADINTIGEQAVRVIDPAYSGPAFVDFKCDAAGAPQITEINVGRFGTTHNFYSAAGANFPGLVLRLALGLSLPDWVKPRDVLPPDLYWIRTLDAGPVLISAKDLARSEKRLRATPAKP